MKFSRFIYVNSIINYEKSNILYYLTHHYSSIKHYFSTGLYRVESFFLEQEVRLWKSVIFQLRVHIAEQVAD